MKYRVSILNVAALVYLIACAVYTILHHNVLSSGEGWGILYMIALAVIGGIALAVDLIIQAIIQPGRFRNFVEFIIFTLFAAFLVINA